MRLEEMAEFPVRMRFREPSPYAERHAREHGHVRGHPHALQPEVLHRHPALNLRGGAGGGGGRRLN